MAYCKSLVYTTARVVKIPNKCLAITHKFLRIFIIFYIGGYTLWYRGGYQTSSSIDSVVITKVKGAIHTNYTDAELGIAAPEFYQRVWDSSDLIVPAHGEHDGGFIILTNLVITPNQTRGICPESSIVKNSKCTKDEDCIAGKTLAIGNGPMTGKCVPFIETYNGTVYPTTKTCEVHAWCPIETSKRPFKGKKALLEGIKDFTVLIKNTVEFYEFGPYYTVRNLLENIDPFYFQHSVYNEESDPYCPVFRIGDVVEAAGEKFEDVAITGGVFEIQIRWYCSFDFGAGLKDCKPKYHFARLDDTDVRVAPGFRFRSAIYHEENRRTLIRNYGLKILIDVEGEGRMFDSVRVILALGAAMGLFAMANQICDFLLGLFTKLRNRFKWSWLQVHDDEMKYNLSYIKRDQRGRKSIPNESHVISGSIDLQEVQTLR